MYNLLFNVPIQLFNVHYWTMHMLKIWNVQLLNNLDL